MHLGGPKTPIRAPSELGGTLSGSLRETRGRHEEDKLLAGESSKHAGGLPSAEVSGNVRVAVTMIPPKIHSFGISSGTLL